MGDEGMSIRGLIEPKSVALVGASDRNFYSVSAFRNLRDIGFTGAIHAVNKRGAEAHGLSGVTGCGRIGAPVDVAYLCVPVTGVLEAAADALQAGIRNLVVLTSGFAETGAEGAELQRQLVALVRAHGARMLGPNCLGIINYADRVAVGSIPVTPQRPGSLAIISASGSTAYHLASFAQQQAIGLSHVIATGNEADVNTSDLLDFLVEDPRIRAVAVFLETVRDPGKFRAACRRARDAGKVVVVLKVGRADATAAIVNAHTGSLVGSDEAFSAVCDQLGVVRVDTFEDLVITAATLAHTGPIEPAGVAMLSISGGACEVMSDLAHQYGVPLPAFSPAIAADLREIVSELGQTYNPIDLTGAAIRDPSLWQKVLSTISRDPQVGLTVCNYDLPLASDPPGPPGGLESVAAGLPKGGAGLILTSYIRPVDAAGVAYLDETGLFAAPGMGNGMRAIGHALWWSRKRKRSATGIAASIPPAGVRPRGERAVLAYLADRGVPVIPSALAASPAVAVDTARSFGGPVVLKIAAPGIAHKTDIGGVRLNLHGDAAVAEAYDDILHSVRAAKPDAALDGVLVSPMRGDGIELFVGVTRDPDWGLVMALGLGGIWVEVLGDTRLLVLPVDRDDVMEALGALKGARLLDGYRGGARVDLGAVADVVTRIGQAALALGDDLAVLEINPLLACGDRVEALDALVEWRP